MIDPRSVRDKEAKAIAILLLFLSGVAISSGSIEQDQNAISVSGANALQPMMEIWAKEYQTLHPEVKIAVTGGGAGKGMIDALAGTVDIGMVSRDIRREEIAQGAFWISVAKNAVIATINENNPAKDAILSQGLTKAQLEDIFTKKRADRTFKTWGQLVGNSTNKDNITVYYRKDACGGAEVWAMYLGPKYNQDNLTNAGDVGIMEDAPLRDAVAADKFGIGWNNVNTVYDPRTTQRYAGIIPVPLDLNGNGTIDRDESFYGNISQILSAMNRNKYAATPARDLYLVTKGNFTGATKEFVNWILTDGQQYVTSSGYIPLSKDTLSQQLEYLDSGMRPEEGFKN